VKAVKDAKNNKVAKDNKGVQDTLF
jgi:hypothetical protein